MSTRSAAELREEFDHAFTAVARNAAAGRTGFLAIRVGVQSCALRLSQVAHLGTLSAITPLPSPCPQLLGVIGFRGRVVPLYDLRQLMDAPAQEAPRWRIIAAAADAALAFDAFEGQCDVAPQACAAAPDGAPMHRHAREVLRIAADAPARPVIHVPAVIETLRGAAARRTGN